MSLQSGSRRATARRIREPEARENEARESEAREPETRPPAARASESAQTAVQRSAVDYPDEVAADLIELLASESGCRLGEIPDVVVRTAEVGELRPPFLRSC